MAKRHHQTMAAESRDYYSSEDKVRHQEKMDSEMIPDGRSSFANMPQQVVMREYPKVNRYAINEYLDDAISGVDNQMGVDHSQMMKNFKPKKV